MFCRSLFVLFHFAIPLSVSLRFTASDYLFGFFWPLYCQSFFDLHLLITPLVSSSSSFVCQSSSCGFWLPLWYPQALGLSVSLWFTVSDYPFGILKLFFCLSVFELWLLITPLVSSSYSIVCQSLIYSFWLHLWYLQALVLSVSLWFTISNYPFGIFKLLFCLSIFDLWLLITPLVSSSYSIVCQSLIYSFWLPLWYHQALVLSVSLLVVASDYPFGIFKLFFCLSVFDLQFLITPFVSSSSCFVCQSLIYSFW
jgi:hypothetical protein